MDYIKGGIMKKKTYIQAILKTLFSMVMIFTSLNILPIFASEEFLELTNLKGTNVETVQDGYKLNNTGGNNHAVSELSALSFTYEVDIEFLNDGASLIFGAMNHNYQSIGTFFGLEFTRSGDADNASIYMKLFHDGNGGLGDGVISKKEILNGIDTTNGIHVKMRIDDKKNLILEVNNISIPVTFNKDFKSVYHGGYLGLLTWNASAIYKNIKVRRDSVPTANFITNLTNLRGLGGNWVPSEDGILSSGNGDNFAISDTSGTNFIYEADVKVGPSGTAGLIFRGDVNNPASGCYAANISRSDKAVRLFLFPSAKTIGTAPLSDTNKDQYHIKVVVIDNTFEYYVDDVLMITGTDSTFTSGNFGLLTYSGTMTYQNVKQTPINAQEYPALSDLVCEGDGVILSPKFNSQETAYNLFVPRGTNTIKIKASSSADTMHVSLLDIKGNVLVDKQNLTNSVLTDITNIPVGESKLHIVLDTAGMKRNILIKVTRKSSAEALAEESQRAQFHFSPEINFMNDPNGLVFDPSDGKWHMFYQYSPQVGHMGSQTWGHAVSTDLMTWEELPVAIPMDELGAIFSGSCVVDTDNTTGFFDDNEEGESKLVALYTSAGSVQQQSLAYSKDHGLTWTKYAGNPVISNENHKYGYDFRDPKIFRYEDTWFMVVAGGRGRLFSSTNLTVWKHEQDFTYPDGGELHSECPDLYPLKIEGTNTIKWIYNGSSEFYVIGDFVKNENGDFRFITETYRLASPTGRTYMYAGQSYYNAEREGDNRRILVSWLQDYSAPNGIKDKRYNGFQSVGTETTLKKVNNEYMIMHYPVSEVDAYRDSLLYETSNKKVTSGDANILANVTARTYDVEATFTLGSATEFGFRLRTGNGQKTTYKYNVETNKMVLDKSKSGPVYTEIVNWDLYPTTDGKITLRALVDNGVIETYGNYGEANISDLCFPDMDSLGMEFFVVDGDVTIDSMKIHDMKSMYSGKGSANEGTEAKVLSLTAPDKVDSNQVFTVYAGIYPNSAANKEILWTYDEGIEVVEKGAGFITFKATQTGEYEITATSKDKKLTKTVKIKAIERVFHTNLLDWQTQSGSWEKDELGMFGNNQSAGDCFYLSGASLDSTKSFIYEGEITVQSGSAAGLVFGVKDKNNPASHWYCINVDKNVGTTKFFKNTGFQSWDVSRPLTQEERDKEVLKVRVEYDGAGKFLVYVDDNLVGEKMDPEFTGGYFGILTFRASSHFDNVYLTTTGKIEAIESEFETIQIKAGSVTHEELISRLPNQVIVRQDDGLRRLTKIDWDSSNVDVNTAGAYEIKGTLRDEEGELPEVTIKVIVTKEEEITFVGTRPSEVSINIIKGTTATEAYKKIDKKVMALFSDGSEKEVSITGWKHDNVDFDTLGEYEAIGYLGNDDTMTIKIKVKILTKDELAEIEKPSIVTPNPIRPNKTINTSDTSVIYPYAILGFAAIIVGIGMKRKNKS